MGNIHRPLAHQTLGMQAVPAIALSLFVLYVNSNFRCGFLLNPQDDVRHHFTVPQTTEKLLKRLDWSHWSENEALPSLPSTFRRVKVVNSHDLIWASLWKNPFSNSHLSFSRPLYPHLKAKGIWSAKGHKASSFKLPLQILGRWFIISFWMVNSESATFLLSLNFWEISLNHEFQSNSF